MPAKKPQVVEADSPEESLTLPENLSEAQWSSTVLAETGQTAAVSIVNDMVDSALNSYHEHIVSNLAKPFAANRAKEMLQFMVETGFIEHDVGEPDIAADPLWAEGDEPVPCAIDSWARGNVRSRTARKEKRLSRAQLRRQQKDARVVEGSTHPVLSPIDRASMNLVDSIISLGIQQSLDFRAESADVDDTASVDSLDRDEGTDDMTDHHGSPTEDAQASPPRDALDPKTSEQSAMSPMDRVKLVIQKRNEEEKKALRRTLAKSGAQRVAYSGNGTVPVFGVNPERLPHNRVVPIVKIEATHGVRTRKHGAITKNMTAAKVKS